MKGEVLRPEKEFARNVEGFAVGKNERVISALMLAGEIHKEDRRKTTGEPYINHCVAVASILESWGADEDEIIAGLLHDTWEDHPNLISLELIKENFGERVAFLVDGVTKLKSKEGEKSEFETLRKVTRESLIDSGVAKIKLSDRVHNMMTMEGMKPETQYKKAKETLSVYAPMAESFGMWEVKCLLEDLSFPYFDRERYLAIKKMVDGDVRLSEEFIGFWESEIERLLAMYDLYPEIGHRLGGYWEIWQKQKKRGIRGGSTSKDVNEIPDVISFRVILPEGKEEKCYEAMGVLRSYMADFLLIQRHSDMISEPAVNGYSVLKDTYSFPDGCVEICFTTADRERFNNWGVTEEKGEKNARKMIFTPKGELLFLDPMDRGIDVAYKLSPVLGLGAEAIRIDGKVCDLDVVVPSSSLVEVIWSREKKVPNIEWLSFANLETKRQIEKQMMVSERDSFVEIGKKAVACEVLAERGVLELRDLDDSVVNSLLMEFGCWYGVSDLYYKIAMGLDIDLVKKKLDSLGVTVGLYTSIQIEGENAPGVAKDVALILAKNKADTRNAVERVFENDRFLIRILMKVDYKGKKKIEEELKKKYTECVVV